MTIASHQPQHLRDQISSFRDAASRSGFAPRAAWLGVTLLVLAALATLIDLPVSRVFAPRKEGQRYYPALGRFSKVINLCETFGYGGTVVLIILLAGRLDPVGMRSMPRLLAGAFGAGLSANVIKLLVGRMRPKAADLSLDVLATFEGWLPMLDVTTRIHTLQSFPSAHTATAFGLATVLSSKYPRGGTMFFLLAAAAGFQRVQVLDHFASDVLCGAAVGLLCGAMCVHAGPVGQWFTRLESGSTIELPSGTEIR